MYIVQRDISNSASTPPPPPLPPLLPPPLQPQQASYLQPRPRHRETRALRTSCRASHRTTWEAWLKIILVRMVFKLKKCLTLCSSRPLFHLLLPRLLKKLRLENVPAALIELPPVIVGPGVGSPLVLGVHADLGRVLAG